METLAKLARNTHLYTFSMRNFTSLNSVNFPGVTLRSLSIKLSTPLAAEIICSRDYDVTLGGVAHKSWSVAENGKDTVFKEGICEIITKNGVVVARAKRCGSLYYLDCKKSENVNVASAKELNILWHRRLGHLCGQS